MASPSLQALGRALKNLPNLGAAGDVQGMREVVEAAENRLPAYWQTTQGRLILRITMLKAINSSKISVVQYLCEERGMPPLAAAPEEFALAVSLGMCQPGVDINNCDWRPLETAARKDATDICMLMLSATGLEVDLSQPFEKGSNLLHIAAETGDLTFFKALVERGMDFDVRNDAGLTPLQYAFTFCRLPIVRFLLARYRARGRTEQEVLQELEDTESVDGKGKYYPLLFRVLFPCRRSDVSEEDRRAMVAFLVQEAGADILAGAKLENFVPKIDGNRTPPLIPVHTYLPLHVATLMVNKPVIDFFLTDCGMPVDTCTPEGLVTPLYFLPLSDKGEVDLLPVVAWLVEEKGADVAKETAEGWSAAKIAENLKFTRLHHYLLEQEGLQAAREAKAKEEEEEEDREKKAAEAALMVKRMQEAEEGMAALLLELEAEEEAAAAAAAAAADSKKKKGKAKGGKKKEK